jgi:hypothetical protein
VDNFEDEKIEKVFLDVDFKDRTILKIVTLNDFQPIFSSYKVNVLLQEIWEGKNTYECDGQLSNFSLVNHLATYKMEKIKGKKYGFKEIVTQNFSMGMEDQKFWY